MFRLFTLFLLLAVAPSWAGIVKFAFNFSAHKAVSLATFPVVHPKKAAKALVRAAF